MCEMYFCANCVAHIRATQIGQVFVNRRAEFNGVLHLSVCVCGKIRESPNGTHTLSFSHRSGLDETFCTKVKTPLRLHTYQILHLLHH